MPRPVKPRKVGFFPDYKTFVPRDKKCFKEPAITLKHEELEAIRLKDIESLHQEQCAEIMDVSRQTFQLILESARKKVATALINGRQLTIEGGDYIITSCKKRCEKCGEIYKVEKKKCPCPKCCKHIY